MRDDAPLYDQEPPPDDYEPAQPVAHDNVEPLAPHNLEAERLVVGAALTHAATYEQLAHQVAAADFYLPAHETIWNALALLAEHDKPAEPVALLAHLRETKTLTQIGGGPYLHTLIANAPIPASASYYANEVVQLARRRAALLALRQATQRLATPGPDHDTDETLRTAAAALQQSVEAIANPNPTTTWAPVDLEAALAGESLDPPPDMLTRSDGINLIYAGGIHTISGESESGKTWVTLLGAVQLMKAALDVVFIDFEDRAERVIGRLITLGATKDEIRAHFRYVRPDRPLTAVSQHELAPHFETAVLVIIDGVTEAMTVHGYDLNSNEDAAKFFGLLPRWIADHGPAVIMIDHVPKDTEKQGRYALGAQHKLAGIDAAAFTIKIITPFGRGKKGSAKITVAKDRPGHVREHALGSRIADFTLDDTTGNGMIAHLDAPGDDRSDDGEFRPTALMERVSRWVQLNPNMSKSRIEQSVSGNAKALRQAVEILVREGFIRTDTGERNSVLHFHIKPFPEDRDTGLWSQ